GRSRAFAARRVPGPELRDERVLDPALRPPEGNMAPDVGLHLLGDRRARLVERRMAGRTDELRLELALRRMSLVRKRRCGEHEGSGSQKQELHVRSACRIPSSRPAAVAGPTMCGGTTRPRRSTKKVSG